MKSEDIISEIHRFRENLASTYGYDVKKIMDHYREREKESANKGHRLVSFVGATKIEKAVGILREKPPEK